MNERRQRPGVMLYFDTLCPALARLDNDQSGELLKGIVDYALTGAIPDLDGMAGMAFDLMRPGIDRDGEKYEYKCMHGQYMAYCKKADERGEPRMSEEEFIKQLIDTDSNYQLPTTTPTPTPAPTASPNATPTASPNAPGKGELEGCKGDEGGNPEALHAQYVEAMQRGDKKTALDISNKLFKMGYQVDKATMLMTRRE